jgi:hypothetical protein
MLASISGTSTQIKLTLFDLCGIVGVLLPVRGVVTALVLSVSTRT